LGGCDSSVVPKLCVYRVRDRVIEMREMRIANFLLEGGHGVSVWSMSRISQRWSGKDLEESIPGTKTGGLEVDFGRTKREEVPKLRVFAIYQQNAVKMWNVS
jgi:hypothetical protein